VRSTNSGVSAIIDPVGRVVAHTDTFHARALASTIAWLRGSTPYRVLGDVPFWLLSLLAAYAALRPPPRRLAVGRLAELPAPGARALDRE
jgi:apolipoprotein N-acyltransferase